MSEQKPLLSSNPDGAPADSPPDYDTAARDHGLPVRQPPAGAPAARKPPPPFELPILTYMKSHKVILASGSPRRKMLLHRLGLTDFEVVPSTLPEDLCKTTLVPFEYVTATARQKCLDVYEKAVEKGGEPDLVISADTVIVTREGRILEKPSSEAAHIRMLQHLRDTRVHRVLSAVCCLAPKEEATFPGYEIETHVEETKVFFAKEADGLGDDVIRSYVRTREGVDKAGGYAIQGLAGMVLVEKVEGSVDNVVGLPVRKMLQLCGRVVFEQGQNSEEWQKNEDDDDDDYDE
ncbi:hypothetical protein PG990_012904 [Apiospora arundinis]|uniref:Inosine triphosphate pyrophosphatase-like protein n=1 Tax=Apiospora arundinis TaxID=335852 RepID=A0ABR2HS53_9PEZI